MKIDLHIHTNNSDGSFSPLEIVQLALHSNCRYIAITDHEIMDDYTDIESRYDIKIISGIEINTDICNMHILGYGIKNIDEVNNVMMENRRKNEQVALEVIARMKNDGYDISVEKLIDYLDTYNYKYDYLDKRKIVKYLIYKEYANNVIDAYNRLIGRGQLYYVPNEKITVNASIDLIKKTGGVAVLAHPDTLRYSLSKLYQEINRLKRNGLEGIEVINGKMTNENTCYYQEIAYELDLLMTVGSDFHDNNDKIGIDTSLVSSKCLERILTKIS